MFDSRLAPTNFHRFDVCELDEPSSCKQRSDFNMAPTKKRTSAKFTVDLSLGNVLDFGKAALFEPAKMWIVAVLLCTAELFVNLLVIWKVKCEKNVQMTK